MEIYTVISLVGATLCVGFYSWRQEWAMSIGWISHLAHTIFSKVFPTVLPKFVVTGFLLFFILSVFIHIFQKFLGGMADKKA